MGNVEISYAKEGVELPLSIRGHHVGDVAKIVVGYTASDVQAKSLTDGTVIPLDQLYKHPVEGKAYVHKVVSQQTDFIAEGYQEEPALSFFYDQYLGENGSKSKEFAAKKADFYEKLFLLPPDTVIEVNTGIDDICRGCQSTPGDMPATHCLREIPDDPAYVSTVAKVAGIETEETSSAVVIPIGFLRDEAFMAQVLDNVSVGADTNSIYELLKEFDPSFDLE